LKSLQEITFEYKYLLELETVINSFPFIAAYNLNIDRKTDDIAFISGRIEFKNGSILDFKKFIESINDKIEKYKYAYNFRTSSYHIFRHDNALDPGAKNLKTFPHHKHFLWYNMVMEVGINEITLGQRVSR
jgi:hypothetical protein